VARQLLLASADPLAVDCKGQTPLHLAAKAPGGVSVIRLLLEGGAAASLQRRTLQPPHHLPIEVARHFARSGARNREYARTSINLIDCASNPLSLAVLRNELVGGLLRQTMLAFILGARRGGATAQPPPRLPPELWGRVLAQLHGHRLLEVLWRLQDRAAQEAEYRAERLASARAAAAESMDLFQQFADDMPPTVGRSLFASDTDPAGSRSPQKARSTLDFSSRAQSLGPHRPTARSASAEAPAALTLPAQKRGLPFLFESDDSDGDSDGGVEIPEGRELPTHGYTCPTPSRSDCDCDCVRSPCAGCTAQIRRCCLDDHATICTRRAVVCPVGCGRSVEAASLVDHYRLQCTHYWLQCRECGSGVPLLRKDHAEHQDHWHTKRTSDHEDADPFHGVPCPLPPSTVQCPLVGLGCEATIPTTTSTTVTARTLWRHMSGCGLWLIGCPGCGAEMPRAAWDAHAETCRERLAVFDLDALQMDLARRRVPLPLR
jgi:hypothetical protein